MDLNGFWIIVHQHGTRYDGELIFEPEGKELPPDNQINYFREIPCSGSIEEAYWVSCMYDVVDLNEIKKGIIGAILLKWIKNGEIKVTKTKNGLLNLKDNNYAIDFNNMKKVSSKAEEKLFYILVKASGQNRILEAKEFEKWSKKNYKEINEWFSMVIENAQKKLEEKRLIVDSKETIELKKGKTKEITVKNVNPILKQEAIKLKGLKKFLLDYSLIPQREYIEVKLWEEYLIFAQLLGIADKVSKQFSQIYPEFNEKSYINTDFNTIAIISIAEIGINGMQEGIQRSSRVSSYDYSGNDTYSGGGGDSYSGGGDSAGGSSGGGFR